MAIDLTDICKKYKGLWVGLKDGDTTVIASGRTVKDVVSKSKKKGCNKPILFRVPSGVILHIGGFDL